MSFILDALKKSESERQRQNGPALFEVKVAPPRSRFALWASILGALLLINGIAVGWVLMRGSTARSAAAAAAPTTDRALAAQGSTPAAATAGSAQLPNAAPGATVAPAGAASSGTPGVATSAALAATTPPTSPVASSANIPAPVPASPAVPADASTPTEAGAQSPEDLVPAVEPTRTGRSGTSAVAGGNATGGGANGVVRGTSSGLPTYQDAAAARGANIPELRLDLHSYSSRPDERFVFLNMTKLHEGDTLPQGVHVESITPDGVILSYQGAKFVLQRQ
jgi:general secretion pathway protein B